MNKRRADHNSGNASAMCNSEYRLWEDRWVRCSRELNQWEGLADFAGSDCNRSQNLILDCAWRSQDWPVLKETLFQVSTSQYVDHGLLVEIT